MNIETELAIVRLYARQSHAIDGYDNDGWARTFTTDGVFESPTFKLTARGTTELVDFAARSNAAAREQGKKLRHHIDTIVTSSDDGRLRVDAYLVILATTEQGTVIDRSLTIVDYLDEVDGELLVASRTVVRD